MTRITMTIAGTRRALRCSTAMPRLSGLAMIAFATAFLPATRAQAQAPTTSLPTGGIVSSGSATITGNGNGMTINQSSQNAAINWNSFSIGAGNTVTFVQPNRNSIALNRVLGGDASVILGNLNANGDRKSVV